MALVRVFFRISAEQDMSRLRVQQTMDRFSVNYRTGTDTCPDCIINKGFNVFRIAPSIFR